MILQESSVRCTNRNIQVILHKENLVWFSVYTIFDVIMLVREKELNTTRSHVIQGISDP